MKRKKIVALILVLMMIVTLMPLSAQAALVPTDKPDYNANRHNRTDAAIVNVALDVDGSSSVKEGSTVNVTIKTKLDTTQGANIYWNSSPTTKKLTDAVGICIATITLKYDSSKVRPNVTGITKHADGLKLHSDTADNENGENSTLSVVYDTEVPTAPKKSIPNNIAWDFKIPFVVQEGAYVENGTNTATIEVLRDSGQTFTSVTKIVEDGSTTLTDDAADVKSGWGNNDAGLYFTSTDVTLNIEENNTKSTISAVSPASVSTEAWTNKSIVLTAGEATHFDPDVVGDKFSLAQADNAGAIFSVDGVDVNSDKTQATLTVSTSGDALLGSKDITVTALAGAFKKVDDSDYTPAQAIKKISVVAPPAVTAQIEDDGDVALAGAEAGAKYAIAEIKPANISAFTGTFDGSGAATIAPADQADLRSAKKIWVVNAADTDLLAVQEITFTESVPDAPTITIDYEQEKITIPKDVKYTMTSADEKTSNTDSPVAISSENVGDIGSTQLSGTAYVPATASSGPASSSSVNGTLRSALATITIPARPTITDAEAVDPDSDSGSNTNKIAGKSKVNFTATAHTTVKVLVNQNASPSESDVAAGDAITSGDLIDATTADKIHLFIPASNDNENFAADAVTTIAQGTGNAFATVKATANAGTKAVKLTIEGGGTWASSPAGIKVYDAQTGDTLVASAYTPAAASDNDLTVTFTDPDFNIAKDGNYWVEIPEGAFDPVKKVNSDGGTRVKVNVTANSYALALASTVSGKTLTGDISGLTEGQVANVTVSGFKAYENVASAGKIKVVADGGNKIKTDIPSSAITDFSFTNGKATFKVKMPADDLTDKGINTYNISFITIDTVKQSVGLADLTFTGYKDFDNSKDDDSAGAGAIKVTYTPTGDYATVLESVESALTEGKVVLNYTPSTDGAYTEVDAGTETINGTVALPSTVTDYLELTGGASTLTLTSQLLSGNPKGIQKVDAQDLSIGAPEEIAVPDPSAVTTDDAVEAVLKAPVTVTLADGTTVEAGTLGEAFAGEDNDNDIGDLVAQKLEQAALPKSDNVPVQPSENQAEPAQIESAKVGDKITGIPEGATVQNADGSTPATGLTKRDDGSYKIGPDAVGNTVYKVVPETGEPTYFQLPATVGPKQPDYSQGIPSITLTGEELENYVADGSFLKKNFGTDDNPSVPVDVNAQTGAGTVTRTGGGGGYYYPTEPEGPVITAEAEDYGEVEGEFEVDENGKITKMPTVTPKLGVEFVGWSTDPENPNKIINEKTFTVTEDTTLYAIYRGYISGKEDGLAHPYDDITRAELARILVVVTGNYDRSVDYGKATFRDTQAGWYAPYIAAAQKAGIVHGYTGYGQDNTFRPNDPISRQEAATMITNAFKVAPSTMTETDLVVDFDTVAGWAKKYVGALLENGTLHGMPAEAGLEVQPHRNITRAEAVVIINQYLGFTPELKAEYKALVGTLVPMEDLDFGWFVPDFLFATMNMDPDAYVFETDLWPVD